MSVEVRELLREGLLDGSGIALASASGGPEDGVAVAIRTGLQALGATVAPVALTSGESPQAEEQMAAEALGGALAQLGGSLDALVVDGASLLAAGAGEDGGHEALMGCLGAAWNATRAAVGQAFLPSGSGGRIVLLAPTEAGPHGRPAAAGLENLARTLSVEWARYGVTTVAVAPGTDTAAAELTAIVAYLASPAGAYFSGCLMDLRGPGA